MAAGRYIPVTYRGARIEKLHKRGPSFYVADDDLRRQGKNPWVKLQATSVQDAVRECREYLVTPTLQRARSNVRFREHWAAIIEWQKSDLCPDPWAYGTRQGYERLFSEFIDRPLGGLRCSEIGPDQVDQCLDLVRKARKPNGTPYSPSYVKQVWKVIQTAFRFGELAKFQRCCNRSQLAGVSIPSTPRNNSVVGWQILSGEECGTLYSDATERFKMLFKVAEGTGGRLSELCGLRWPEVDLDSRTVTFLHQLRRNLPRELASAHEAKLPKEVIAEIRKGVPVEEWLAPLKGRPDIAHSEARTVPISDRLASELRDYKAWLLGKGLYRADGFVFPSRSHLPISQRNVGRALEVKLAKLKKEGQQPVHVAGEVVREKPVGMHSFRHAYATRLFMAGVPVERISQWLGHSSIDVTIKRYARIIEELRNHEEEQAYLARAGL